MFDKLITDKSLKIKFLLKEINIYMATGKKMIVEKNMGFWC